jgi:hypothetical protein
MTSRTNNDAADFYLGRGEGAQYLGTATRDASPEQLDVFTRFQELTEDPFTEDQYRAEVAELVNFTRWPWLNDHIDSISTPWTYMWDRGSVYVYRYGVEMAKIVANYGRKDRDGGRESRPPMGHQFPIMATRQAAR